MRPVTIRLTIRDRGNRVKCLAQGHNKQTCLLVLHTILLMLNIKQGSSALNINFLSFLVRLGKGAEPRSTVHTKQTLYLINHAPVIIIFFPGYYL